MSDSQGGPGRREVAFRLFAAEYDDADFSYSESDEERAPNYVITPTGARVNRLFVVGVLTEVENVSEDYLRARVVDPTGPFVVYAGQYQPEAMNFLERAEPPMFVAVTGKARTFQPEDSDLVYTSIRPESISEVDAETRDRWVVQAAEQTIERVTRTAEAKLTGIEGERLTALLKAHDVEDSLANGIPLALDHYETTGEYLAAVKELALDSARVVAGERDEVEGLSVAPEDGTDDPLPDLTERTIDVDAIEPEEGVDLSDVPEPDSEPEPTDEEIDEAVESADLDTDEDTAETTGEDATAESSGAAEQTVEDTTEQMASEQTTAEESGTETTTSAQSAAEETATESTASASSEDSTSSATGTSEEDTSPAESETDTEMESESEADVSADADETPVAADDDTDTEDLDDDLEEFDGEFELDEEERAEIEEQYGTEFQSGTEVEEPGEADIETPDTEPPAEPGEADALDEMEVNEGTEATGDESADVETEDVDEAASEDETATEDEEAAEDVDLDDAVMDAMTDLDDGDGADRDALVAAVVDRTDADPGEVEDAIQEALMDGRCYEPDDETLKAI